jgi:hypothetical protein
MMGQPPARNLPEIYGRERVERWDTCGSDAMLNMEVGIGLG